jgi:hypothetical protein
MNVERFFGSGVAGVGRHQLCVQYKVIILLADPFMDDVDDDDTFI